MKSRVSRRPPLFVSPKAAVPIRAGSVLRFDVLIQAALDPEVYGIEYISSVTVDETEVAVSAIVIAREDGRWSLDLPERHPLYDLDDTGLLLLAAEKLDLPKLMLSADDIARNPRAANARLVWESRSRQVVAGDRVLILNHLDEAGPCRLVDVACVARSAPDGVTAVLALACQDLVELDLVSAPLGPDTLVRRRRRREVG